MAFRIVWTEKAVESYRNNINYLQIYWSPNTLEKFIGITDK